MSITISIKSGNDFADISIPTEWKDITLDYWSRLAAIIAKHQKNTELKKESRREQYADAFDLDKILDDVEFLDGLALNKDIFMFLSGLNDDDMKRVDMNQVNKVIETNRGVQA